MLYNNVGYNYEDKTSFNLPEGKTEYKVVDELDASLLTLPLSLKYYLNIVFDVSAGVNLGYFISAKDTYSVTYTPELPPNYLSHSQTYDVFKEDEWNSKPSRFYAGPFVGAEYNFNNGFFIDGRYNLGVLDMKYYQDPDYDKYKDSEKINYLQIGIGYKFSKKK